MKKRFFTAALLATFVLIAGSAYSQEIEPQRIRTADFGIVGYRGAPQNLPAYKIQQKRKACCKKTTRAFKLRTVEICRRAFTKSEKHCCGIVTKGNYIRVVYKTYYSDGSEVICTKEYRS